MEISDIYIVFLDASGIIVWTSDVQEEWTRDAVWGNVIWNLCVKEDRDGVRLAVQTAVEQQQTTHYTAIALTPGGERQGWRTRVYPTGDALRDKGVAACVVAEPIAVGQAHLTGTEIQILKKFARDANIGQLGRDMDLSPDQLHMHLTSCKAKLQVTTHAALREYALKHV